MYLHLHYHDEYYLKKVFVAAASVAVVVAVAAVDVIVHGH